MTEFRPMHPDFLFLLELKEDSLINLFCDLRAFILEAHPACNEMLYHTHALTAVFSINDKLGGAFCTIPIYTNHLNLAFNMGTRLPDPYHLLTGTGNLMRHVPIKEPADFRNDAMRQLIQSAIDFAIKDLDVPSKSFGKTISKITKKHRQE